MEACLMGGSTYLIDIDGTIVKHNGYLTDGYDTLLDGVSEFWESIKDCKIVLLTARDVKYKQQTEDFFVKNNLRFDHIIYNLPTGPRFLINDKKPDGTLTAFSTNLVRNKGL